MSAASGHACAVCGSVYRSETDAARCALAGPGAPEEILPGTLIEVKADPAANGPGLVRRSYLIGLDDSRGVAHARFYRASFIWGSADFAAKELTAKGPATEAEWRAAVMAGPSDATGE